MISKIVKTTKIILIGSVLIVALLSIFFVLDIFNNTELKEGISKIIQVAGILVAVCFAVVFLLNYPKEKS